MGELVINRERREAWGMATDSVCHVARPTSIVDIQEAFRTARANGWTVAFWGNGRSYGDAALNESNLLLDFRRMNRVIDFDADSGLITVEPGITLVELEHYGLPRGFWPPVVSGTMHTTLGGCIAANVHGKNNWKYGPWGDHVVKFTLVTTDGEIHEVDRDSDPDLFTHAIGGFGLLGAFASITVKLKKVYSGRVAVTPVSADDLGEMFSHFRRFNDAEYDYVVGWIDAFPGGSALGRGQIHAARYLDEGEDLEGARMLSPADQSLPPRIMGVLPKSWLWWLGRPWAHPPGMRLINFGRYWWMKLLGHEGEPHYESHARFNHLLDFVPNWKWYHGRGGLIQYQLFLPKENAQGVMSTVLELCRAEGLASWLVVMKRHRADAFPLSHAVDGYSFAMDFNINDRNRERLYRMTGKLNRLVVDAGGRFYFAKDSVVTPEAWRASLGDDVVGHFFWLKQKFDPDLLIQGNLWRRVMAPLFKEVPLLEEKLPAALEVTESDRKEKVAVTIAPDEDSAVDSLPEEE